MRTGRRIALNTETDDCEKISAPLILDLMGPFVVQFQQGKTEEDPGIAIICAPLCVDHYANILTDSDDVSLAGNLAPAPKGEYHHGYVYRFKEDAAPRGASRFRYETTHTNILRVKYAADPSLRIARDISSSHPMARKCHLVVVAPMPNRIVALRPEAIWIHRNQTDTKLWVIDPDKDPTDSGDPGDIVSSDRGLSHGRGRGLRFIYEECSESPTLSLQTGDGKDRPIPFCALTRGLPVEGDIAVPRYHSMSLRFAATHASAEEGQEDAYTCFQQMRALFDTGTEGAPMLSEFSKWRVDFSNPCPSPGKPHIEHIVGGRPHDCGAATMALQDWDDTK